MNLSPIDKLSSAEARKLSSFLRSKKVPQGTMTLNQLKGYLLCICSAPELLQTSYWLPPVFANAEAMPEFESTADFTHIELIMRLYNQINADVLEGNPKLPGNCILDKTISNNFKPGSVLHEWSLGFDVGLHFTAACWDDFPLEELELDEEVESLWMMLSFFADEQRARTAKTDELATLPFQQTLEVLRRQLPWMIKNYAQLGRAFYELRYNINQENDEMSPLDYTPGSSPSLFENNFADDGQPPSAGTLIDAAYNATNPAEIVTLANQALKLDPNCVDAFLLLAEWDARNEKEYINFLQQAVNAGEKALGPTYFEDNSGYFWGLHETRPYMQALCDLAAAYKHNKQPLLAISLLEKALHLNPRDNQGNRHYLITLYLEQQQLERAENLLEQYPEDQSAFMQFSQLLLHYIRNGDSAKSQQLRKEANGYNKYVAKYLNGRRKMPKKLPEYYGVGNVNEAVLYVAGNRELWRKVMGATPWLLK